MRPRTLVVAGVSIAVLSGLIGWVVASGIFGFGSSKRRKVKIELNEPSGSSGCKINKITERLKAGDDDDIVEWEIKNKCSTPQTVELHTFTFTGKVPDGEPDETCVESDPANEQNCPLEGQAPGTCMATQWVRPRQGNNDGKAKIARAANTRASDRACYKYHIRIGGDDWDPEWVIWR